MSLFPGNKHGTALSWLKGEVIVLDPDRTDMSSWRMEFIGNRNWLIIT